MNVLTIHHLCCYLEEIGIIDQTSLAAFLSIYSLAINKNKQKNISNNNIVKNNMNNFNKSPVKLESILCAYLKKIFSIEKNYKIFSNKIINKFKQKYILKQYNGISLLFSILKKVYNSYKIHSFYKILNIKKKEKIKKENNIEFNNSRINITSALDKNDNSQEKKLFADSFRIKHLRRINNNKENNKNNNNKSDIFNKSEDFLRIKNDVSFNNSLQNTLQYIDSKNKSNNNSKVNKNIKNIQLEFKKKQFMSKIRREHTVKFKRSKSFNKIKNNSNIDFESKLLSDFSQGNFNNNNIFYKQINIKNKNKKNKNINNNINNNEDYFNYIENNYNSYEDNLNNENKSMNYKNCTNYDNNNNSKYSIQGELSNYNNYRSYHYNLDNENKIENEETFNNYKPSVLNGDFSTKSINNNFNSFVSISPSTNNQLNRNSSITNYKLTNRHNMKNNIGYIIKKNENNNFAPLNGQNKVLTMNDIERIKQKLLALNKF